MKLSRRDILLGLSTLILWGGCGRQQRHAEGQVSGTVMLNGSPLTSGQVIFFTAETGSSGMAQVDESGHYEIRDLAAPGEYTVTVTGQEPMPDGPPVPPSKIPAKYESASTSGLTLSLKPGANTFDIDLKE